MSYYSEPNNHVEDKAKVLLDLWNYVTATGLEPTST